MPQSELPIEVRVNAVKPRSTALELDLRLGPGKWFRNSFDRMAIQR